MDNQSSHRNYRDLKRNRELGLRSSASVLSSAVQMPSLSLNKLALRMCSGRPVVIFAFIPSFAFRERSSPS